MFSIKRKEPAILMGSVLNVFFSVVVFLPHPDLNVYCLLQTAFDHIDTEFVVENKVRCRLWPAETVMST